MFPVGLPGVALVLLRVSVASPLVFYACARHAELGTLALVELLVLAGAVASGFLTPIATLLAIALQWLGPWGLVDETALAATTTLNALALALLGPGAYSIDSYRFGRRVVEVPSGSDR